MCGFEFFDALVSAWALVMVTADQNEEVRRDNTFVSTVGAVVCALMLTVVA